MALTLREMVELTQEQFHLQLLAGSGDLDHIVTWVHMMEYTNVTEFFWGNEVVVTGGYALQKEEDMFRLIDTLEEHRCAGLVINVGKYIAKVPEAVIAYCEEKHLPLLTMPWKMYITEFVKECCSLIHQSSRKEELMVQTLLHVVFTPQDVETCREQLDEFFQEENGFQMIAVYVGGDKAYGNISDQRKVLRLHTAMRSFSFPYLIFRYEKRFFILLNEKDCGVTDQITSRILQSILSIFPDLHICIGTSETVDSYEHLTDCFHGAISASRCAALHKREMVRFQDMGFYKLLYSVPDDALLLRYYHEVMDPVLIYDRINHSAYTETLMRYLLCDGSLKEVAAQMFTHRNTINYRMGKIRELLGCGLDTQSQRLPYLIAYHIGVILKLTEDLEETEKKTQNQ